MTHRLVTLCLVWVGSAALARGDEPKAPQANPVPVVEIAPRVTTVTVQPGSPYRFGTREVWQNYGVDSMGRWRPVAYRSPFSTSYFYLYNGQEYYWPTVRPLDFMPYAD